MSANMDMDVDATNAKRSNDDPVLSKAKRHKVDLDRLKQSLTERKNVVVGSVYKTKLDAMYKDWMKTLETARFDVNPDRVTTKRYLTHTTTETIPVNQLEKLESLVKYYDKLRSEELVDLTAYALVDKFETLLKGLLTGSCCCCYANPCKKHFACLFYLALVKNECSILNHMMNSMSTAPKQLDCSVMRAMDISITHNAPTDIIKLLVLHKCPSDSWHLAIVLQRCLESHDLDLAKYFVDHGHKITAAAFNGTITTAIEKLTHELNDYSIIIEAMNLFENNLVVEN